MPILDIRIVQPDAFTKRNSLARELADATAAVFGSPSGSVWVRLEIIPPLQYGENGTDFQRLPRPVFVTVLHADLPEPTALAAEAKALSAAIATTVGCVPERVHVEYSPQGRGRVAFGGTLLV